MVASNHALSTNHENRGKPAFKLFNVLECPTEFCFKNQNNLGEIDNQIKELD